MGVEGGRGHVHASAWEDLMVDARQARVVRYARASQSHPLFTHGMVTLLLVVQST